MAKRYIDIHNVNIPKGFFNQDLNVPKLYEWLESQPEADVAEVRHGKWEFVEYKSTKASIKNGNGIKKYRCSECGRVALILETDILEEKFPYCNCGAKMDLK